MTLLDKFCLYIRVSVVSFFIYFTDYFFNNTLNVRMHIQYADVCL